MTMSDWISCAFRWYKYYRLRMGYYVYYCE